MATNTRAEDKLLTEKMAHYQMAKQDLETRYAEFDIADELFRSHIEEGDWPYSALIFIPRVFSSLFEKTSRLIGSKPKGRLVPREGGDVLGAKINNEILSFQWDDTSRVEHEPMIAKWARMDMNTRKYGAGFALCKWHFERRKDDVWFDGPVMKVCNPRDVLANPSYSNVKMWFQHREYLTLSELTRINDVARTAPVYKNLETLRDKIKETLKTADTRAKNYTPRNLSIKGYEDFLGRDEYNKVIEIVTEYTPDRWVVFAPNHGVIIRDIENPYKHGEIPVVQLKYYSIDDDLYGMPEWEPVEKPQKAINALTSQYIDAKNMELYAPIAVDSTRVRMHTLEFGMRKKWIVTGDPRTAIQKMDFSSPATDSAYKNIYSVLVGEMQEALGETSALVSNVNQFSSDKTATEVKDSSAQRLARDNFNQIFLAEAIKKQMMFWRSMNQQYMFDEGDTHKIIRISGKDAIQYFQEEGLDIMGMSDEATNQIIEAEMLGQPVDDITQYQEPAFPVDTGEGMLPKMQATRKGDFAEVAVTPEDLAGNYDYIPDIETMQTPNTEQILAAKRGALEMAKDPAVTQALQMEGKRIKMGDLLEDYLEDLGFKDAGKFFESQDVNSLNSMNGQIDPTTGQPIAGGAGNAQGVPAGAIPNGAGGVSVPQEVPGGSNIPLMA